MPLKIKRVYEQSTPSDGFRILVDRLWPRGLTKSAAHIDEWLKDLAPSDDLRKWFGHRPERWNEFVKRYRGELRSPSHRDGLLRLRSLAARKTVTLVFSARDETHSNAQVLFECIMSQPPPALRSEPLSAHPAR